MTIPKIVSGFKVGMIIPGEPGPSFNACVFATRKEAEKAGIELLSRWYVPTGYEVLAVAEEPNYQFSDGRTEPLSRKEAV